MDIDRCIQTRRSVRKYLSKKISWEKLKEILDSARYAPSSGNLQNWRFVVVQDPDLKKRISQLCSDQEWINSAPVLIVVCSYDKDLQIMYREKAETFSIQNTAAAIENMLLKANSLSIDSCWVGSYNEDRIKSILKIPDEIRIDAVITLGYGSEKEETPKRIDLRNIAFYEEWGDNGKPKFY
jgi:nitroreductase